MDYQPRPGSLAARVCAWFKANPGRSLMASDICARFGTTTTKLAIELGAAEDADYLTTELRGRSNVYSAGPKLAKWTPASIDAPPPEAPPAPAPAPTAAKRTRLPRLDLSALAVKEGELLEPTHGRQAAGSRYEELFALLTKPNTWVEVPTTHIPAIKKALQRHRKDFPSKVFRCVKFTEKTHQLQRLADATNAAT